MNGPPIATDKCPVQELHLQRMRFGTRELLTAMLLSSVAFASQPAVGWKAAFCMMCVALALVMGWGFVALAVSIAALSLACYEPNAGTAATVCCAVLLAIAFGPLVVHKFSRRITA